MRNRVFLALALGAILASSVTGSANPPAQRDPVELVTGHATRYVPAAAGTEAKLSLLFGPYTIPPGQDSNRITVDLPPIEGFITAVAPELVDASNGRIPTEQEAHIHHAHWFRVDTEGAHEPYTSVGPASLSWVFGTGEEKSQGLFEHRSALEGENGNVYGMPVEAAVPQVLIYMIHNKTSAPLNAYVVLDVRFIHGSEAEIEASPEFAGRDLRPIEGTLWGQTRDATAAYPELSATYASTSSGTIVAMGSHLHPSGKYAVVANLGPGGQCSADLDGDGFPGTTVLTSRKFDRIPGAMVNSEDYQMGTTKFGWRAPIHQGDHLAQYAPYAIYPNVDVVPSAPPSALETRYADRWDAMLADDPGRFVSPDGLPHAAFEAMTYTGMYVDRFERAWDGECSADDFAPTMLGNDTFAEQSEPGILENVRGPVTLEQQEIDAISQRYNFGITEGMINHAWVGDPDGLCGIDPVHASWFEWKSSWANECTFGAPPWSTAEGIATDTIQVSGFTYLPGDLAIPGELGAPPVVTGDVLTLINDDAAINVRHTFTSCPAPCNGAYVANYPLPDGIFDSDKMGNVDPIDGGFSGDWMPIYELDVSGLDAGVHTYFCRIHPWMRGSFEIA
ncbi:MAG TPA: hypothetical protein VGB52_08445 [Actinomycetota bacterium]